MAVLRSAHVAGVTAGAGEESQSSRVIPIAPPARHSRGLHRQPAVPEPVSRKAETDRARGNAADQATTTFGGRVTEMGCGAGSPRLQPWGGFDGALSLVNHQGSNSCGVTGGQSPGAPSVRAGRSTPAGR